MYIGLRTFDTLHKKPCRIGPRQSEGPELLRPGHAGERVRPGRRGDAPTGL
jgi:hypothetical protein